MASDDTASHLAICLVNGEMGLLHSAGEAYATQPTASDVKVKAERGSTARFAQSAAYAARSTEPEADCGPHQTRAPLAPVTSGTTHTPISHLRVEKVPGRTDLQCGEALFHQAAMAASFRGNCLPSYRVGDAQPRPSKHVSSFGDCVLMRTTLGHSQEARLREPHLGSGAVPSRAMTIAV
jgi:hypothetical protein